MQNLPCDYTSEEQRKQAGMKLSAMRGNDSLVAFRTLANMLSMSYQSVTIDDVRRLAEIRGITFHPGKWMGSVFNSGDWEWTGEMRKATHVGSHARMIKVWRRK